MFNDLPEGWAEAALAEGLAIDVQPGFACGAHNRDAQGIPHLRPMNVSEQGRIDLSNLKFVPMDEIHRDERLLRYGDVLFNNTNSPELVGKTACYDLPEPRAFSNHMTRVRCQPEALDSQYCALVLHMKWMDGYFASICNNHVSQASVSRTVLLETLIPLPPLAEQQRIVAKVELLLARVKAARQRLAKVPEILKRFRQSVLAAACSGRLTADWRDDEDGNEANGVLVPTTWQLIPFGELVASIRSGSTAVPEIEATPFPILRSSSVRPGLVDLHDVRYLHGDQSQNQANYLRDGDMLFTRLSGSLDYVANCAIVRGLGERRIQYPDRLFCARLNDPQHAAYAELVFGSPMVRRQIEERAKSSAGHQRISMGAITEQVIPLPPLSEQHEIVRRVEALFGLADAIEKRLTAATARAEKLTQAILAKAFRGELVPTEAELAHREGRAYEPASALLERIRAEKEKSKTVPKAKSRRTKV
jgi:type I restriction enzyme S subunit